MEARQWLCLSADDLATRNNPARREGCDSNPFGKRRRAERERDLLKTTFRRRSRRQFAAAATAAVSEGVHLVLRGVESSCISFHFAGVKAMLRFSIVLRTGQVIALPRS